ncbi:MAG: AMP-binding protein [Flavobacteriales bacterium]|jgi:long-chain acyl-CoA synthetase|nr:AMP-binding protein [Flavobacteriales bacterium]
MSRPLPLDMMYRWERESPDLVYMRQPINGKWHEWTWKETGQEVRKMAAYLKGLGYEPGTKVAMISKNCAHWIICDLAIQMAGYCGVPLYPNLNDETINQILTHSESKLLFVGKLDDWASMRPGVPDNVKCIAFPFYTEPGYEEWYQLVKDVAPIKDNVHRDPMDMATIIYTSGTTGMPKGVLHKFHNFGWAAEKAMEELRLQPHTQRFFSYLPLCHIAERLLVEMGSIYTGSPVSFAESLDTFAANLAESKPTVFLGVPRIWSKFQQGILGKMPQKKLDLFLKIPILNGIVKKKIKTGLGLAEAENIFTGAAPTPASLIIWFAKLDINIQEAYAMTENCCYSHVTRNNAIKVGYVGQALPDCDVKLSDIKEILIKHDALMDGYYKEPELTAETMVDGWLRTGDEGYIDDEGFLKITGRVKDLFKTTKGKYVAPSPIEMSISENADLDQVCVVGDGIPQPLALLVISESGLKKSKTELTDSILKTLDRVNPLLDHHEQVKKAIVVKTAWTVENELLTPTMKIKRNPIEKIYHKHYEKWYESPERIIWE